MNSERFHRVEELYHSARELEPAEREAFLARACRGDAQLRREVESLLAQDVLIGPMEQPPLEVAANLLADATVTQVAVGTQLGAYRIEAPVGAGGMGEVYQAHDTKLGREVAIKILPAEFAHDADRLSRFQREAKMLAALNHPNIATIHGLERSNSTHYLVMELVPGETLAERIKRDGALPIEEALKIAVQIAEAFEAAHEKGIIHRDLKPANVKVTPEGRVKVLDFGLAKAFAGDSGLDLSNGPTLTAMGTEEGKILGTPAYMSPEQARGKPVDKRTDIWAFGCVLYELLTGKRAFRGETTQDTVAAILERAPDWQVLPATAPTQIHELLRRCLQKDKTLRLRDAGDVRIEIHEALTDPSEKPPAAAALKGRRQTLLWSIASSLAVAIVVAIAAWNLKPAPRLPVTRLTMSLPPGERLDTGRAIAISPDGTRLVYAAGPNNVTTQLYIRAMDGLEARPVPGTEGGHNPFFSPNGQWIGFTTLGKLMKVSTNGGATVSLAAFTPGEFFDASWSSQGKIAFATLTTGPLQEISDAGGNPQPLTRLEKGEQGHRWPEFLPGGTGVLFAAVSGVSTTPKLVAQSLTTGARRDLLQAGIFPRYALSGHVVYAQGTNLMAVPFDPQRLAVKGAAVPVVESVLPGQYGFSSTGLLVYVPGSAFVAPLKLVWVDRKGTEQIVAAPAHNYVVPRISPDGQRVAVNIEEADSQIWLYDLSRDTLTRLTFEGSANLAPLWTPDGKRIAFKGTGNRLFWQPADGSGNAEALTSSELAANNVPASWSPNGQVLAFMGVNPATGFQIFTLSLRDGKPQPFVRTPSFETAPRFSPDGHFIAYVSDESGRFEIYVRPYPGPGSKWQISTEGGTEPAWNPKGRELFFRNGNKMMAVDVTTEPTFSADKPKMLFEGLYVAAPRALTNYDVSPDGQRFLMIKPSEQNTALTQIVLVQNWFEELKRRVPTGK
jgi:serine/threonine-protein kinase